MKTDRFFDILSKTLLCIAIVGMIILIGYNLFGCNQKRVPQLIEPSTDSMEDYILFFPEYIDSIQLIDDSTGYYANVYYMGGHILYTSYMEGESLIGDLENIYSNYSEDSLELEEQLGFITDNSDITILQDGTETLSLWYVQ